MAQWKRFTLHDGNSVDVNMEHVVYMTRGTEDRWVAKGTGLVSVPSDVGTTLYFSGSFQNKPSEAACIYVKETPDEIHLAKELRSL